MLPPLPGTDPTSLYRLRDGLYAADLLTAALVELDLFTCLHAQPADFETVCRTLHLIERPADVAITLFKAMGLITTGGATLALTDQARDHLVRTSPFFLGPYYASFRNRPIVRDFVQVLHTGRPSSWSASSSQPDWATAMRDPAFAAQFTAAMDSRGLFLGRAVASAVDLGNRRALLDVAGGSGIYACCLVDRYAHLRATVLERPPVDTVSAEAIANRGFASRVAVHASDMFADTWPDGHDVHLFSNVLHDWDVAAVSQLLERSARALPPGGLVIIHDAHLDDDKAGPLPVAAYSALLMHSTEGRCYSGSEMRQFLVAAGFSDTRFAPTVADRSIVTAIRD
jgi:predicted O-methyltransferase YrrM